MRALRDAWARTAARYAALSLRERRLVAAAVVLGPLLIGNAALIDPQFTRARNLRLGVERQQGSLADLKGQAEALQIQLQVDPDAAKKAELAAMKQQLASVDERLKRLRDNLVAPEEMNALLESLLAKHPGLRLVGFKTLPPESIVPLPPAADGKPAPARQFDIYKHGVELRLEGNYLEMLAYLERLEKADQKLLWGPLRFNVIQHPRSQLTVTVYTLGSDKTWLAI